MRRRIILSQWAEERDALRADELFGEAAAQLRAAFAACGIAVFQAFRHERLMFAYLEGTGDLAGFDWPEPLHGRFMPWPGSESLARCVTMVDIFHDGDPEQDPGWREGYRPERAVGSIARLKPEMYSSYVYYHYQAQEEKPGSFNRSYIIGSFGTLLFSYHELPAPAGKTPLRGKLQTRQTPEHWHAVMEPHFERRDPPGPGGGPWKELPLCFGYRADESGK